MEMLQKWFSSRKWVAVLLGVVVGYAQGIGWIHLEPQAFNWLEMVLGIGVVAEGVADAVSRIHTKLKEPPK